MGGEILIMNVIELDNETSKSIELGWRIESYAGFVWYVPIYDPNDSVSFYQYTREEYLNGIMEWA
jgi:hypothetical protein